MAFFDETFDGFGTDALLRLLLHRLDDFLDVFGGVVKLAPCGRTFFLRHVSDAPPSSHL